MDYESSHIFISPVSESAVRGRRLDLVTHQNTFQIPAEERSHLGRIMMKLHHLYLRNSSIFLKKCAYQCFGPRVRKMIDSTILSVSKNVNHIQTASNSTLVFKVTMLAKSCAYITHNSISLVVLSDTCQQTQMKIQCVFKTTRSLCFIKLLWLLCLLKSSQSFQKMFEGRQIRNFIQRRDVFMWLPVTITSR